MACERTLVRIPWHAKVDYFAMLGRQELVLVLNSGDGGIPHREANIRVDGELAIEQTMRRVGTPFLADPFRFVTCSFGLGVS